MGPFAGDAEPGPPLPARSGLGPTRRERRGMADRPRGRHSAAAPMAAAAGVREDGQRGWAQRQALQMDPLPMDAR